MELLRKVFAFSGGEGGEKKIPCESGTSHVSTANVLIVLGVFFSSFVMQVARFCLEKLDVGGWLV